ncbi:Cysteine desulfurase [Labilithrix luteola]|uniref:Cysteine desulfurase n=1 Tax=Labilithrix luteola TaxID=1391654 RepID=A0A0K1PXH7_9BACT|nr:family 2A encapsulin nanocompartment cargo protein cysteine desulfurase [Labilithrix luteola]AKU97849.1 Cysteine desulfurase [Labilithrix luteola]
MSTPESKGGPPPGLAPVGEVSLLTAHMPRTTETPNYPSAIMTSTPGIALAAARIPGGPTLPELDAISMTNAISQLANQMYAAPPANSVPPTNSVPNSLDTSALSSPPTALAPSMPSTAERGGPIGSVAPSLDVPSVVESASLFDVPSTTESPAPFDVPGMSASTSPFDVPLNFDALATPFDSVFHFPLNDVAQPAEDPKPGFAPAPSHSPSPSSMSGEPRFALDSYEITPTGDPSLRTLGSRIFEPNVLKKDFPILSEPVRGKRLVWLDNAATTQKPRAVIDRLSFFYEHENSNIHRAAHTLAAKATDAYEAARETVRRFINAPSARDIVFVRGTTEGINLVAQSWGRRNVREGDEIVITWLEHHANIVPWQQLCSEKGARLRVAPVDDRGQVILEEYEKLLGPRTRLVSFTQVSNALGTITPAVDMIDMAHRHGAVVLLDGAQAVSHMPVDVQALGCDFFVFSGHKVFAPTGIGAVFGRAELLEAMPPWQGGGNMIQDVTFERTTYQPPPARFEAGTGNIADAVGLGAALDWLTRVGVHNVERYEHELLEYGTNALLAVPGLTLIGTAPQKAGVLSFVLDGKKTEEVGGLLDQEGIAVRSGHHCAQPILRRFGLEATVRASLAPYNTCEDIDALARALHRLQTGR